MQDRDDYYNIDQSLARLGTTSTVDELEYLRSVLLYATDEGSALDEEDRYVREEFDKEPKMTIDDLKKMGVKVEIE